MCVWVCYQANCYIPRLKVESQVPIGFLCCSQRMYCVDFVENALFKSYGEICWSPLPSLLLDELLMNKRDSNGFFSTRLARRPNDKIYNSTDSSLVTVHYQQCFLACFLCCVKKLLIRHVHGHAVHYAIAHVHSCGCRGKVCTAPCMTLTRLDSLLGSF